MSTVALTPETSARQRILDSAAELFFYKGYRATTLEEIMQAANVSEEQFRDAYESKDELCMAYLRRRNDEDAEAIWSCVSEVSSPLERYLRVMECIEPWLGNNKFRGCAFLNIVAELPNKSPGPFLEGKAHYERVRSLIVHLAGSLIVSDEEKYGHLDPDQVADEYMVILTGAISLSTIYQNAASVEPARRAVQRLLEK